MVQKIIVLLKNSNLWWREAQQLKITETISTIPLFLKPILWAWLKKMFKGSKWKRIYDRDASIIKSSHKLLKLNKPEVILNGVLNWKLLNATIDIWDFQRSAGKYFHKEKREILCILRTFWLQFSLRLSLIQTFINWRNE